MPTKILHRYVEIPLPRDLAKLKASYCEELLNCLLLGSVNTEEALEFLLTKIFTVDNNNNKEQHRNIILIYGYIYLLRTAMT